MTSRLRLVMFGLAATLVLAGAVCAILIAGVVGEVLTIVLMSVGLTGGLLLVFFEIGVSEEQELARDDERRDEREQRALKARRSLGGTDRAGGHTNHDISRQRNDHGHKRADEQEALQHDDCFNAKGDG